MAITPAGMAVSHAGPRSTWSCVNNSKAVQLTVQGKKNKEAGLLPLYKELAAFKNQSITSYIITIIHKECSGFDR